MQISLGFLLLFALINAAIGFQLFVPMEGLGNRHCGQFKKCPNGTICMRLYNRLSPISCFEPKYADDSAFLPPIADIKTTTIKPLPVNKTVTRDEIKMIELPGCTCPPKTDPVIQCWANNLLSILFLITVLALVLCTPVFSMALTWRQQRKY